MRYEDLKRLEATNPSAEDPDVTFSKVVGVDAPEVRSLYDEIYNDLDENVYGVGWWAPHPGTKRRILASHYLLQCVKSIETNLLEAALHHLEALDYWEKESNFVADSVTRSSWGGFQVKMPPRTTPVEGLAHRMAALHTVGFFRALVGALDCLGASVAGVHALPIDLRFASLTRALNSLKNSSTPIHIGFRDKMNNFIATAGPTGWLEWLTDYRHMVVHRGRRLHMKELIPRPMQIYGPNGQIALRVLAVEKLPLNPYLSQVEEDINSQKIGVLTESAADTMLGALNSSLFLLRNATAELLTIWRIRRQNPSLLPQPTENWPDGICLKTTGFIGYKPGSLPNDPTQLTARADVVRQLLTAALADHLRHRWDSFD